jgi:hypothetical protein
LVEAAGVALVQGIENTQVIHFRNARSAQIAMSARFAYKSRTNNSQNSRISNSVYLPIRSADHLKGSSPFIHQTDRAEGQLSPFGAKTLLDEPFAL